MKNGVNLLHRESLFDLNDKKVNWLFVALKNVDRVIAFAYQNFVFFTGEELRILAVTYGCASELEGCIQQWDVLRERETYDFRTYLDSFKDLVDFVIALNLKSFQSWVLECRLITFCNILFYRLFLQIPWYFLYRLEVRKVLITTAQLLVLLFLQLF